MSLADTLLAVTWLGVTAYALFGCADFGAGFWDLVAGGRERGWPTRRLIEKTIAPIWEANHVWLIFVLVVLWTAFPPAFAAIMSTLIVPMTLAAVGIIGRGAAFAFRKEMPTLERKELFGAVFAVSSILTPFFLGAAAGAVASGRVPVGNAAGDLVDSWLSPTGIVLGLLAVGISAYLAAVYLTREAERQNERDLTEAFRRRAMAAGTVMAVLAATGLGVLYADSRALFDRLVGRGLPLVLLSAIGGVLSLVLLAKRRYTVCRATAAVAVTALLWGWAAAQYPDLLPGTLTIHDAAAPRVVLVTTLVSLGVGALVLIPSLGYLYVLFQRSGRRHAPDTEGPG
jgi:cytochrome d ubiquinol oxidase subunit II